jgi:hypothetical protein
VSVGTTVRLFEWPAALAALLKRLNIELQQNGGGFAGHEYAQKPVCSLL